MTVPARVGVILAGGGSKRFGRPKPLFAVGYVPVIRRVAEALRGSGLRIYVSSTDPVAGEVLRVAAGGFVKVLLDDPGLPCGGPARAMASAAALGYSPILFVPSDMPWLTSTVVVRMLLHTLDGDSSATVVAWHDGRLETLTVVLGAGSLAVLAEACRVKKMARVRTGDALRASKRIRMVPASLLLQGYLNERPLLHIETPQDYPYPPRRGRRGPLAGPIDLDNARAMNLYLEALSQASEDPAGSARLFAEEAEKHLEAGLYVLAAQAYRDAYYLARAAGSGEADMYLERSEQIYGLLDRGEAALW